MQQFAIEKFREVLNCAVKSICLDPKWHSKACPTNLRKQLKNGTIFVEIWTYITRNEEYFLNILIIHPSFPGQYYYLCRYLAINPENKVVFLAKVNAIQANLKNVDLFLYDAPRSATKGIHHYLVSVEEAVLEGQKTIEALHALKQKGFQPDVIIGHAGWGSLMYIKDYYPNVPLIGYFEWYYHSKKSDMHYWPGEEASADQACNIRTRNMFHLLSLEACDYGITPTEWQYSQFPDAYKPMLNIIHEGVDTKFCCPFAGNKKPALQLEENGFSLPEGTEFISYVSRGFEPIRGFDKFMDAIRIILKKRPNTHVVLAGNDMVCYGNKRTDEKTYKQVEEEKGGYDKSRVHFVGSLNRGDYQRLLQLSSCHVYLTRPFILSWSMLEAMSFGLPLVASATPPVMEVVEEGVNGLLAEFRSPHHIATRIEEILSDKGMAERLGKAARNTILERYDLMHCMRQQEEMLYKAIR